MKKIRKTMLFLMCMTFMLAFTKIDGQAAGPFDGLVVDGSMLTSNLEAKDTKPLVPVNPFDQGIFPYGDYLSNGTAQISNQGGGTIYISGGTYCYETCNSVQVNLFLERYSNGSWGNVTSSHKTVNDAYVATDGFFYAVKKGYYYRVRGGHVATKNGTTESTTTCTDGIYID